MNVKWPESHGGRVMPEFEGTSESLSFQGALEDAVRKAYTAYERRTHTDPLFSYVVKRISGHLRTLTVVIETVLDEGGDSSRDTHKEGPIATQDPIRALLEKQRRKEELTANEQALIDLLLQEPKKDR
jgi:hypothetical protein